MEINRKKGLKKKRKLPSEQSTETPCVKKKKNKKLLKAGIGSDKKPPSNKETTTSQAESQSSKHPETTKKAITNEDKDSAKETLVRKRKRKRKKKLPPLPAPDPGAFEAMLVEGKENQETHKQPLDPDLAETEKTESPKKQKTKAKRMKKVKEIEPKTETENITSAQLAIDYLQQWQNDRKIWSFKKVRQVWLLHHMYDRELVSDETFSILLDYLQNAKGTARTKTIDDAEAYFKSCEDNEDATDNVKLQRSRELIQYLS